MARKRMIDPSIWTDEGMAELTPRQQLLYIGFFSNADDDGRLKASPAALRLILPTLYSAVPTGEIAEDIDAVVGAMRQLIRYEVDGRTYIAFRNYRQWQRIDKPSASILPGPPDEQEDSTIIRRSFDEPSESHSVAITPSRKEEKGREEKGVEEKETPPTPQGAREPTPLRQRDLSPKAQELFDRFWRAYPRRQAKAEAVRWWQRARPDPEIVAAMLDAIARQLQGGEWQKEAGRFIPMPATWLNQRRWEDETVIPHARPSNHPAVAAQRRVID